MTTEITLTAFFEEKRDTLGTVSEIYTHLSPKPVSGNVSGTTTFPAPSGAGAKFPHEVCMINFIQ